MEFQIHIGTHSRMLSRSTFKHTSSIKPTLHQGMRLKLADVTLQVTTKSSRVGRMINLSMTAHLAWNKDLHGASLRYRVHWSRYSLSGWLRCPSQR